MIGVVIPDRGDRPRLLNHCKWMLSRQTMIPDYAEIVNYQPLSDAPDLTARVRNGFETMKRLGCECVFIIENDDYYAPDYIKTMYNGWVKAGKPDIYGTPETTYYHIRKKQYRTMKHPGRSSLFNTLISCKSDIVWPKDSEVFLDVNLWGSLNGNTLQTDKMLSIGIKHGIGKLGGKGHTTFRYDNSDPQMNWLSKHVDKISLKFYSELFGE